MWARDVFVGTSGYTSKATPELVKKIIPIGSYIITTEVLPEALARELSPRNRQIYDSKNYLYYYRLTPDHRMLFGGRAAFFPESEDSIRRSAELLRRGMIEVYPQLRDTKVEFVWGGTLDFAFDIMPHAGEIDGIYYALGYAGHGVAMATWQGQKMAELITGGKPDNPFVGIPFPGAPLGLYNGNPWFLPFAGMYYKFLDWVVDGATARSSLRRQRSCSLSKRQQRRIHHEPQRQPDCAILLRERIAVAQHDEGHHERQNDHDPQPMFPPGTRKARGKSGYFLRKPQAASTVRLSWRRAARYRC
jgi:hypothetical protein